MRMTSSTQYRQFAEECLRLAKKAQNAHQRNDLKQMAEVWSQLAAEAEKKGQ